MKIDRIEEGSPTDGSKILVGLNNRDEEQKIVVEEAYLSKHMPQVGGYYVEYLGPENYRSFSPAAAFEEGYQEI